MAFRAPYLSTCLRGKAEAPVHILVRMELTRQAWEPTWNRGHRSSEGIRKSRATLAVYGRMSLFEKVDSVCLFAPRTAVRVGELNLQQVETEAGLFLDYHMTSHHMTPRLAKNRFCCEATKTQLSEIGHIISLKDLIENVWKGKAQKNNS